MNNAPPVNDAFIAACDKDFHEKCREEVLGAQHESALVNSGVMDETATKGNMSGKFIERDENGKPKNKRDKDKNMDRLVFRAMLQQLRQNLRDIEASLAGKYGENFAEQLAADLLPPDKYEALMKIEDKEERRRAIAQAINDGVKNGTIDPNDPRINDDYRDWLNKHEELKAKVSHANDLTSEQQTAEHGVSTSKENHNESAALDSIFAP